VNSFAQLLRSKWLLGIGLILTIAIGYSTRARWWDPTQEVVRSTISGTRSKPVIDEHDHGLAAESADPHAGHDHGADESGTLELSAAGAGKHWAHFRVSAATQDRDLSSIHHSAGAGR
jgi:hypothetical protein